MAEAATVGHQVPNHKDGFERIIGSGRTSTPGYQATRPLNAGDNEDCDEQDEDMEDEVEAPQVWTKRKASMPTKQNIAKRPRQNVANEVNASCSNMNAMEQHEEEDASEKKDSVSI